MRIHSLILLSFLLLATQVLSERVRNGAKNSQHNPPDGDPSVTLGKAPNKRGRTSKSMTNGKFVTKDQATCRWAVTEQDLGISLKVECTQADREFSCVFTGDPAGCLRHNKDHVYWKQIARTLRKHKNICGNAKSVLKTRVCKKQFPESNLKLANLSGPENKTRRKEEAEVSPREHSKVREPSSVEPTKVMEGISSSPAVTKTMPIKNSECLEDPDVVNQRKTALEFCGESWSSFCTFFLNMLQATSC